MKNSALKKFLFSGILIWGSLAGGLLSCGKKELLAAGKEVYPQRASINGELQWKSGFHWDYFPQSENSEKIGYFVSKEGRKKQMKEAKQQIRGTMDVLPNGKMIEVWHDRLPEEHQLYIRAGDSVYILYGEMDSEKWQNFLEEWLFTFGLKWNGVSVMKEEGTVLDTYTGDKKTGRRTMLQCGKGWIKIDKNILLFHRQGEGFYLKTGFTEYEREVEETILCLTENYPKYGSAEETVSYFQNQYPGRYSLNAYLLGEDTLWNFEEGMLENIFYEVEDLEGIHGFFLYEGRIYVYDEDTYLIGMTSPETSISKSDSIIWEDGDGNKEQALVIYYVDGGELTLYLSEVIQPDYQPNE